MLTVCHDIDMIKVRNIVLYALHILSIDTERIYMDSHCNFFMFIGELLVQCGTKFF
jgi:hypothetical protein